MKQKKTTILILLTILIVITSCRNDKAFTEYEIKEFSFKGHDAKIVFPHKQNQNNYWIWRARFWGHEPQVDKALLEKGFHVVYVDVANMFGNNEAVELWNEFYSYCIAEYGLNQKVVLEGMSRGGLIVYNWASKNTEKVYCIYADAPVCDIKSWPGGMYNGIGSPEAWELCLKAYDLDTIKVKTFKNIPINNSVYIAKAGIPVLHVYGDVDIVVPYKENTFLLAEKFRDAGGTIELIRKKGVGHHPHSLKDPKPIIDFILKNIE
jgi:pimeloyl-ACP methyl ester carboxylesterase